MGTDISNQHSPRFIPIRIVLVYAIVSGLWIAFSDYILEAVAPDPRQMLQLAIIKGWLFVLATSALIYYLIRVNVRSLKDINEELRESERRFRNLMEQVHMIAIMLDTQGNIIFCNDYLLKLTGWTREELIGKNWMEHLLPGDIKDEIGTIFNNGVAKGEFPFHQENRILTHGGAELLIVWDNTLLFNAEGSIVGMASLGIDITEQRGMEDKLRQSQKMESIGTLAGGVAHDFNNILTVIISSCEMLRAKTSDPERSRLLLDQINSAAQRAAKLTHNLLTFSRKQLIKPQRIDLNYIVGEIRDFLERIIGEDVELLICLDKEELPILADQGQIGQVLMNLAGNARDAMPNGGRLSISTEITVVDGHVFADDGSTISGEFAVLKLEDTGTGIDRNIQERIFEPFYTTKEIGKGTGLGLSMVYGIIRQHNGWITLESESGKGSIFTIHLPLDRQEKTAQSSPVWRPGNGSETVLLVEDDGQVLEVNKQALETNGYHVIPARDAFEALERFQEHSAAVKLAIIDIVMPKMNGRQLYDALMKVNPGLRVLFISGYTGDLLKNKGIPENCPFIAKPLAPQELLQTVRKLLDQDRQAL